MRSLLTCLYAVACLYYSFSSPATSIPATGCTCDSLQVKAIVTGKDFNRLPEYDTAAFHIDSFYKLDAHANRLLWFRDVENADSTRFTRYWNDYARANYHASHADFIKYYTKKKDIELAFQMGPNMDLWAFHIFVAKKINCCYLLTHSYFRHARFTHKSYTIIDRKKLDSLYTILGKINCQQAGSTYVPGYAGYFVDNRNNKTFYINFDKEVDTLKGSSSFYDNPPKKEIKALYDFLDNHFHWIKTYPTK